MSLPRLLIGSAGVRKHTTLPALLDDVEFLYAKPSRPQAGDSVLAWGMRPSAQRAIRYAKQLGLPVRFVEDGFLRSVGLGADDPPLSVVVDDVGLYLDASQPTALESLIQRPLSPDQQQRTQALIHAWQAARVSKYNHTRDSQGELPANYVLVVDQTYGDASVAAGGAGAEDFTRMLNAALVEYPDSVVMLKVHPDVVSGRKRGYFDIAQVRANSRVVVMDQDVHPATLLKKARAVYTVTSQMGFEALIWGKPVRVFGMPFYAGWGLTHDAQPAPARRHPVPLFQLVYASLIGYCRYVDPETGKRCDVETVVAWLALQREMRQRFPEQITAVGFSRWKHGYVRDFFNGSQVRFAWFSKRARQDRCLTTWGRKSDAALEGRSSGPVIRVEDGFLRSVGLGADLVRPVSWVQDDIGIYYDATRPSRLEHLIRDTDFSAEHIHRSQQLRVAITDAGLTKYNLQGKVAWVRPPHAERVVLVVGQVETDASIKYGASHITRNIDLLQAVRENCPDAYVLYKPHPDVMAGLRSAGQGENEAQAWCDEVIGHVSLAQLFPLIDEVHVLTSLAGFEALLRDKRVVTYGQPFYAGWGLTDDMALTDVVRARRTRSVTLDELVAATLILYPTYVSRITRRFTRPEQVLRELITWRDMPQTVSKWRHWIARIFREK